MAVVLQQDLFDVENWIQLNEKKRKQKEKVFESYKKLKHFEEPKNDNERLLNYQYEFLVLGNKKAWDNLFILATKVAQRIVVKQVRAKHLAVDAIDIPEKVSIAVEYVMRRYKNNSGWVVRDNYISAIKSGVIHALYYRKKIDDVTDYGLDDRKDL